MDRKQFDNAIEQLKDSDSDFERVESVLEFDGQPMGVSGDFLRASNLHAIKQAIDGLEGCDTDSADWLARAYLYDGAGNPTPAAIRCVHLAQQLVDYPVLDDDDYLERRWTYAEEHGWECYGREVYAEYLAGDVDEAAIEIHWPTEFAPEHLRRDLTWDDFCMAVDDRVQPYCDLRLALDHMAIERMVTNDTE